jgi:hypothetical protein
MAAGHQRPGFTAAVDEIKSRPGTGKGCCEGKCFSMIHTQMLKAQAAALLAPMITSR